MNDENIESSQRRLLESCKIKIEELLQNHDILSPDDIKIECDSLCSRINHIKQLPKDENPQSILQDSETTFWFLSKEKEQLFEEKLGLILQHILLRNKKSLWEAVRLTAIQTGILKSDITRERFSVIIATLCPQAGTATQIKQNSAKYIQSLDKKRNDIEQIRQILE